ncbi:ABC transporter substrate binding protein [Aliikangiella sp. IMCC44359]|uniref:ABC transporter substrate binding protein n=1 Tax=Aliikangiella sp. IMCC44359 TaxID=3459125 RepID=UPI00403AD6C7
MFRYLIFAFSVVLIVNKPLYVQAYQQEKNNTPINLSKPASYSIPVFYENTLADKAIFLQALRLQLEQKLAGRNINFIDVSQMSKREIEAQLESAHYCAMGIGEVATKKMLSVRKPINHFSVLVSRNILDQLNRVYSRLGIQLTGIYQEQPFSRQLFLSKALNPNIKSVAILLDQSDKYRLPEYIDIAQKYDIKLNFQILRPNDPPEKYLTKITQTGSYLLITNNQQLFMKSKLAALVLSAYYRQINLIGSRFEDAKIGTLASIYTAPTSLSIETSSEFKKLCENQQLMPPRYAKSFSVIINKQIAGNMKLHDINTNELSKQINQMEAEQRHQHE